MIGFFLRYIFNFTKIHSGVKSFGVHLPIPKQEYVKDRTARLIEANLIQTTLLQLSHFRRCDVCKRNKNGKFRTKNYDEIQLYEINHPIDVITDNARSDGSIINASLNDPVRN